MLYHGMLFLSIIWGSAVADNLALLSGTLRTYQRAGCDDEYVTLRCPPGTSISVQIAQYGASSSTKNLCKAKPTQSSSVARSTNGGSCLWPNSLQTVIEVCQKKRQCKFVPSPKTFGGDPCPGVRKYVEIAYKCRPYEFRSKVSCQNDKVQFKCNPNSRVAIYSASYGRTEYESIQCPQPPGVPEETCLVGYATETVMQMCHGKRSCNIVADIKTFGNPCHPESRMYLKVVYTCVPMKVLKEQLEGPPGPDEMNGEFEGNEEEEFEHYDAGNEFIRESAASPSSTNIIVDSQDGFTKDLSEVYTKSPPLAGLGSEIENPERFYLYLIISITAAVVLCLSLLVGRLLIQRHRIRRDAKFHATTATETSVPNGFTDDISEIDADIDLSTPLPIPSVAIHSPTPMGTIAEVVRYPHVHTHTLRRALDSDLPRSLSSSSNPQYYYG